MEITVQAHDMYGWWTEEYGPNCRKGNNTLHDAKNHIVMGAKYGPVWVNVGEDGNRRQYELSKGFIAMCRKSLD